MPGNKCEKENVKNVFTSENGFIIHMQEIVI